MRESLYSQLQSWGWSSSLEHFELGYPRIKDLANDFPCQLQHVNLHAILTWMICGQSSLLECRPQVPLLGLLRPYHCTIIQRLACYKGSYSKTLQVITLNWGYLGPLLHRQDFGTRRGVRDGVEGLAMCTFRANDILRVKGYGTWGLDVNDEVSVFFHE